MNPKGRELNKEQVQKIADSDYKVPEGIDPEALIPELIELLGSTDQMTRERSFEILDVWGEAGRFSDEALRSLGQQMADNLACGLGDVESDSVFLRAYSALVLCTPVCVDQLFAAGLVDGRAPFLSPEQVRNWCDRAVESLRGENDLRGFIAGKGWADAVSHMGDTLCQLARSPHTRVSELEQILEAIADRLTRPTDTVFVMDEGSRLMKAVYHVLLRGELPLDTLKEWIKGFSLTSDGKTWGWKGIYSLEFCDYRAVNARLNVCEALRSLYFLLKLGMRRRHSLEQAKNEYYAFYERPIRYRDELMEAIVSVQRSMYDWLYPKK
ncbi:DUF2785 domain-containing protein [Candidatus Bipolaricaulota bacterium]